MSLVLFYLIDMECERGAVMMRTTVHLDDQAQKSYEALPRRLSFSAIVRWLLALIGTNQKEWLKLIREEGEIKEVQDYMRPKLQKALGLSIEDK